MTYYTFIQIPAGTVLLTSDGENLTGLHWKSFKRAPKVQPDWVENAEIFAPVIQELNEYFAGTRTKFDIPFRLQGTEFQKKVWAELTKLPFGTTTSYQVIANSIGKPGAVRAVGTAIGSNPISILVPCHRVLTSDGKLGGYAGGLESKETLLKTERAIHPLPL